MVNLVNLFFLGKASTWLIARLLDLENFEPASSLTVCSQDIPVALLVAPPALPAHCSNG